MDTRYPAIPKAKIARSIREYKSFHVILLIFGYTAFLSKSLSSASVPIFPKNKGPTSTPDTLYGTVLLMPESMLKPVTQH